MNLSGLVARIKFIFPRPEHKLLELLPSLQQLRTDLRLARTIDYPLGINLFYDVTFDWWSDKRISNLIDDFKKVRNQERDEIVGYLSVIRDQVNEINRINDRTGWRNINEPGEFHEVMGRQSRAFMGKYISLINISINKLEEIAERKK